jgi:RNA polymerase sigma-70 factor (ECF subfamily)
LHQQALEPENLQHIIKGCIKKNPVWQEKLYRLYYPALYLVCKTFFSEKHDIISALNNGMLRVYANIHLYDAGKGSLYGWMHTVVRNAALTYLRDSKKTATIELTPELKIDLSENPFTGFDWEKLLMLLDKLPTDTKAVVVLFYVEEQSIKEIAILLDMKEGTVKWHLSEGRKKLRKYINPQMFSERYTYTQ